jgi:hypothetical protein
MNPFQLHETVTVSYTAHRELFFILEYYVCIDMNDFTPSFPTKCSKALTRQTLKASRLHRYAMILYSQDWLFFTQYR